MRFAHLRNLQRQFFGLALVLCIAPIAQAALPRELRVPGGVALVKVGNTASPAPTASRDGAKLWVARRGGDWVAVVGIALSTAPGEQQISVETGGATSAQSFRVNAKSYPVQKLKLDRAMVDPPSEVMARIERESSHLKSVRNTWRADPETSAAFIIPATGPLSSRFGVARVLNGQPRSPHAGLDVAVATGSTVIAPGDGIVVDTGDYYFCGKGLFVDHGSGLITMYCHLSEFIAKNGDRVKQGEPIARSGGTGRATGPHLHWSVFLNGVSVEPELFLPAKPQTAR